MNIEQKKQNIVVIMDSYYPDSRATTHIMRKILEQLSQYYNIYVFVLDLLKRVGDHKPDEHRGIKIEYAEPLVSMRYQQDIWMRIKSKYAIRLYKKKLGVTYGYDTLYVFSKQIIRLINRVGATKLISVSSPTDIHICAEMVMEHTNGLEWFPVCFDPHAYNSSYTKEQQYAFIKEELILYRRAKSIFMLRQAEGDYQSSVLKNKIVYFDIPMKLCDCNAINAENQAVSQRSGEIKIMYIGNIYKSIRNPDYMLELFSELPRIKYTLYVIGAFIGWKEHLEEYINTWKTKYGSRIQLFDRMSRSEIQTYIGEADFFVNLGNTTENQCPSKVLDYISTGKPIIHIKKINNCASMIYLGKYPNVCVIDEQKSKSDNQALLTAFIERNYGKVIEQNVLSRLYRENDISYISEKLMSYIDV